MIRLLRVQSRMTANTMNMPWSDFRDRQRDLRLGPWAPAGSVGLPSETQRQAAAAEDALRREPPLTAEQHAMLVEESEQAERDAGAEIG